MVVSSNNEFLHKLKHEAQAQARLEQMRLLPSELDSVTSFIGRKPWQVLLIASGITSLGLELLKFLI